MFELIQWKGEMQNLFLRPLRGTNITMAANKFGVSIQGWHNCFPQV